MCYTFVLMFLILYVSAVLAVELITKNKEAYEDDPETYEVVNKHFGGLLVTMLTLVLNYTRTIACHNAHASTSRSPRSQANIFAAPNQF